MSHVSQYFLETVEACARISLDSIEQLALELRALRDAGGRLFIAGLGGSAANASHAANDFRKLCAIETYALNDNVAELTARANDEGWETIYAGAMRVSRAASPDALLVLSVGGGTTEVSRPLLPAIDLALERQMRVLGIVGPDGGDTAERGHCVVHIPRVHEDRVTPHTEAFQAVVLHCLASHPKLQSAPTKW